MPGTTVSSTSKPPVVSIESTFVIHNMLHSNDNLRNRTSDVRRRFNVEPRIQSSILLTITLMTSLMIMSCCFFIGFGVAFQPLHNLPVVMQPQILHRSYNDRSNYGNWHSFFQRNVDQDQKQRASPPTLYNSPGVSSIGSKYMQSTVHTSEGENDRQNRSDLIDAEASLNEVRFDSSTNISNASSSGGQYIAMHRRSLQNSLSFKDQIQKCKDSVNIIDVIESYQLDQFVRTNSADRAIAVCPFHDDHHPSLHIDASRQIYKCFACNAGGDVIHFVQEYSKLPINNDTPELSFMQALQHINFKFGDGTLMFTNQKNRYDSSETPIESAEITRKKERILLANTYAALFYTNCLKEPYAGGARYYLRSTRGLSSPLIKTIMIGYAPDTYYDHRFTFLKGTDRPTSLANHLLQSGFTSQEILDSGLAVVGKNHSVSLATSNSENHNDTHMVVDGNSSLLMDRFRGRIIVPIFDEFGTNIIGFGGRIIPPPESNELIVPSQSSNFKAAKYLNSPESLVFKKRNILFNQHVAFKAIHTVDRKAPITPLLLVEGYMDVISLCEIGVCNVAATMGTAISPEQLDQASKTAGYKGGKIVLCLDNDDAGKAAIERLCRNGIIEDCIKKNVVSIHVARLPNHVKDPAEFIESRRGLGSSMQQVAADFRSEVVANAVDWTEWYIQTLISGYKRDTPRGSPGSFSDAFERIAEFLANSLKPAERTKVAYEVAGQLSSILAHEHNSTEMSLSVRIQLESDLIDLAARLSASKEVLQRRIDAASTDSAAISPPATFASFTSGLGPSSIGQQSRLSTNATKTNGNGRNQSVAPLIRRTHKEINILPSVRTAKVVPRPKIHATRATITRSREPNFVSVTTHFSGFQFTHQSDMDWLGLQSNKFKRVKASPLVLGQYQQTSTGSNGDKAALREKQVYFNSASFNGYQFLTDTAINAGYTASSVKPDTSLIEYGLASIVQQDVRSMMESSENSILRILVNDGVSRSVVKNMLNARKAVNYGGDIQWSTPEKRWLFELLVYSSDVHSEVSLMGTDRSKLHFFLSNHPNAPPGAFSPKIDETIDHSTSFLPSKASANGLSPADISVQYESINPTQIEMVALASMNGNRVLQDSESKVQSSIGTLDLFFDDEVIPNEKYCQNDSISGTRNELAVQEILVSLLWASTALKSQIIQAELISYSKSDVVDEIPHAETTVGHEILRDLETVPELIEGIQSSASKRESDLVQLLSNCTSTAMTQFPEFNKHPSDLLTQFRDTTHALQALKESSNRIALRLLDESSSSSIEGAISQALQTDLASQLDDHIREVSQYELCPEPGINDLPYEIELERMAEEWGDWYDDDYVWTPGENSKTANANLIAESQIDSHESDLERETLEDFFERVDREWRGWDD